MTKNVQVYRITMTNPVYTHVAHERRTIIPHKYKPIVNQNRRTPRKYLYAKQPQFVLVDVLVG